MNSKEFFYSFGKALYRVDGAYGEFAKNGDVSPMLLWILYALNDGREHTQREICVDWDLPKSTINTIVGDLKESGFVSLEQIKGKRREMTVTLTESGKIYAEEKLACIYKKEAQIYKKLNEEDKKVIDTLNKIVMLLNK